MVAVITNKRSASTFEHIDCKFGIRIFDEFKPLQYGGCFVMLYDAID
ncbi:hypothetical protein AVDCRST_MAG92-42 [uncultured Coleofasciculus sp.]|uniref:Uncharacterized protein n=1 Tax=uncultured Coleofasciculus sp. TaxID=1267456 RepID=A0A6J4H361_9CYAN|nr:hypothetical protein AVDCRST_MAG92-42 [uncultured Coleofasciculus sp.]